MENNDKLCDNPGKDGQNISAEIKTKMSGYIVGALGLVAGLAWNDAIKSLIEFFFPNQQNTVLAKIVYAAVITLVVVILSIIVSRLFIKKSKGQS